MLQVGDGGMLVVDLFCGCGGLSRGFEDAGFEIVASYDGWPAAIACYNANFAHIAEQLDLNEVTAAVDRIQPLAPNMIIGGPPCQEFSNAGKREEGAIADLTYKYAQIVTQTHPQYFLMENVPRVKGSTAYMKARALYKAAGYGLTEVVLDAGRCGAPQKRNRFFCIGAAGAQDNFMLDVIFSACDKDYITVRQYFAARNIPLEINDYYRHPTTYHRRGVFSVDDVAPTVRGVNRPKPATYKRHPNDSVKADELGNIRQLTLRERARIQTFPEGFIFENVRISNGDFEQMVGNAVPVVLARSVAMCLRNYIEGENRPMENREGFSTWLRDVRHYTSDRSISDVFCRIQRAKRFLPNREIDRYFLTDLELEPNYQELSTSVRSQIKKAIKLRIDFLQQQNADG